MTKRQAKRRAYHIAGMLIQGALGAGEVQLEDTEEDSERLEAALEELSHQLIRRGRE